MRRDIDAIDDAMLELLIKRFAIVEQVKAIKEQQGTADSPFRPAREAEVVRRLQAKAKGSSIDSDFLVRLWQQIFNEASRRQADVSIHVSDTLGQSLPQRLLISQMLGSFAIEQGGSEREALQRLATHPNDVAIVSLDSPWIEPLLAGVAGRAGVINVFPSQNDAGESLPLLVIGHAKPEPTGSDETLIVSKGSLPRAFPVQPLWQVANGIHHISALPGFLSEKESPLLGVIRSNGGLGLKTVGRYPAVVKS